jgi:adenylate cyclase class 2
MSQHESYETEVKLLVTDHAAVEARLSALGADVVAPRVLERNARLDTPDRQLGARRQVLRLRADAHFRLTFKSEADSVVDGIIRREEYEVTVSDYDALQTILARLGFIPYMTYEKYRTTYHYAETEIVLDELPYGRFVEIEGDHAAIEQVIRALDLSAAPRIAASYTAIFEQVRQALGLTFTDLSFANFEGISVPWEVLAAV